MKTNYHSLSSAAGERKNLINNNGGTTIVETKKIVPILLVTVLFFLIMLMIRQSQPTTNNSLFGIVAQKQRDECQELAHTLSDQYRSAFPYNNNSNNKNSTSLTEYLNRTGILLTLCVGSDEPQCGPSPVEDHVAASWIQKSSTGLRMMDRLGSLGLILDPMADNLTIDCMYPADASTDRRDHNGCGSFLSKNKTPEQQQLAQERIRRIKDSLYGPTPWEDIPCAGGFLDDLYTYNRTSINATLGFTPSNITFVKGPCTSSAWSSSSSSSSETTNHRVVTYTSGLVVAKYFFESIMEQKTVCYLTTNDTIPRFDQEFSFIYNGDCSWKPQHNQWHSMVESMQYLIRQYPKMKLWNEIVIRRNSNTFHLNDLVKAVFYTSSRSKAQAYAEAFRLGGKPVLEMLTTTTSGEDNNIFRCSQ